MIISLTRWAAHAGRIAIAACLALSIAAEAQTPPASPVIPAPPGKAQQDLQQSDHAVDFASGHSLVWDAGKKSWIDTQTGEALGFQGAIAKDGTVIPAPAPTVPKTGAPSQAKQDPSDPERAYNAITGQTLVWNRVQSTWIDTRSQRNVGFQGAFAPGTVAAGGGPGASPAIGMMYGAGLNAGTSDKKDAGKDDKKGSNSDDHGRGGGGVTVPIIIPLSQSSPPPDTTQANGSPPLQPSGGHTVERPGTGTPPTQTATTSQSTQPSTATTPPTTPPGAVCGPVVTDKVFATLKKMTRDFNAMPGDKVNACHNLYGLTTYEDAWDILGLDPGTSPGASDDPGYRGDPNRARRAGPPQASWNDKESRWVRNDGARFDPWLTAASKACAIPRPDDACAATVQFMGTCQHAQVVNYVMWGRVNKLCGFPLDKARLAVSARSFFGDSEMSQRQLDMTNIGYVTTNPEDIRQGFLTTPSKFQKCELKCPIKLPANPPWSYRWIGFNATE